MLPENFDEKQITDIVMDVICVIVSVYVLDICFRNIVKGIFDIALKIGG